MVGSTINVMGKGYKVVYANLDPDTYGECHGPKSEIRINRDASPEQKRATLVHELIHAILYETGLNHVLEDHNLEEALVRATEHGLLRSGLIRDFDVKEENLD